MCNFFRFCFTVVPRGDDRIATPLFHTVYIPLQKKRKKDSSSEEHTLRIDQRDCRVREARRDEMAHSFSHSS